MFCSGGRCALCLCCACPDLVDFPSTSLRHPHCHTTILKLLKQPHYNTTILEHLHHHTSAMSTHTIIPEHPHCITTIVKHRHTQATPYSSSHTTTQASLRHPHCGSVLEYCWFQWIYVQLMGNVHVLQILVLLPLKYFCIFLIFLYLHM